MIRFQRYLAGAALAMLALLPSVPTDRTAQAAEFPTFTDIAETAGTRALGTSFAAAFEDYDGDGLQDIFVSRTPGLLDGEYAFGGDCRLYRQVGNLVFEEIGREVGVDGPCENRCIIMADYDEDGDLDIYTTVAGRNELFRAVGDGTFEEFARDAGLDNAWTSHEGFWFDYDKDGLLDLFFTNGPKNGSMLNKLYHNEGDGNFRDVSVESGTEACWSGKGAAFIDFDEDGWMDIFHSSGLGCQNYYLFRNMGDGTFQDVANEAGVATVPEDIFSSWSLAFDHDNDGDLDVLVGSHAPLFPTNVFWVNNGDGTFTDQAVDLNLDLPYDGSSALLGDLDNDGWIDVLFGQREADWVVKLNDQGQGFVEVEGNGGLYNYGESPNWTLAQGDVNDDGFIDIYVGNGRANFPAMDRLYISSGNENNYLYVTVEGTEWHRSAAGAKIRVTAGDLVQYRWVANRSRGTCSCPSSRRIHFGLGDHQIVDEVRVFFPNGNEVAAYDVPANGTVDLVEPENEKLRDEDRDGVPDLGDLCPWTPGLSVTDELGCAEFEGGDGTERLELDGPVDRTILNQPITFTWSGNLDGYRLEFDEDSTFDHDRYEIGPLTDESYTLTVEDVLAIDERFEAGRIFWRVVGSTDEVVLRTPLREMGVPVDTNYIQLLFDLNIWDPEHIRVTVGTEVTWHVQDAAEGNTNHFSHDVLIADEHGNVLERSRYLQPFIGSNELQFVFTEPGTFYFMCVFHSWSSSETGEPERIAEGPIYPGPYPCHSGSVTVEEP